MSEQQTANSGAEVVRGADEMEAVDLLTLEQAMLHDRVESKVVMPTTDVPDVLRELREEYLILDHLGGRLQPYRSAYFDAADLRNYHEHHNQRRSRVKVRYRTYVTSQITFFEVKQNVAGRTVKHRRRSSPPLGRIWDRDFEFFVEQTGRTEQLIPSITIEYDRILLVRRDFSERVTIDLHLRFEGTLMAAAGSGFAICEFKQPRFDRTSPAMAAVSQRPQKFSKYCMGLAACDYSLKRNRFKEVFRGLDAMGVGIVPEAC